MLIEYQFKFEKNGLTLKQRIEPSASGSSGNGEVFVEANALRASYQECGQASTAESQPSIAQPKSGGGPADDPSSGGGPTGFGTAPVTFIGPFIMCCPCDDSKKEKKD